MGDPRHCTYQDVKAANRYNWYFTQVNNSDYTGFTMSSGGWSSDGNDIDAPRFYQIYRSGLLKTQAIWSAMNGWSYYYYGFGGEFGSDVAPLKSAIKFVKTPWSKTGATGTDYFDEILPYKHTNCNVDANVWAKVVATTDDKWYAKTWLGELYDDSDYSSWKSNGNQPTGAGNYYRANYDTYSAFGRKRTPRAWENGCSSFFNGTSSSGNGPFSHVGDDSGLGAITTVGISMSNDFSFPLLPSISCTRPFKLDKGSGYPLEWYNSVYSSQRTNISIPTAGSKQQNYYSSDNSDYTKASAVVRMSSGTQTCYVVVSGLATQSDFGTGQMGKFTLIGMLEAFFAGGLYSDQDAISQVPRVQITSPKVSDNFTIPPTTSINIAWSTTWKRWDSTKYTQDYLDTYSETTPIVYAVKYSPDGGHTWKYCADDMATTAGSKDLLISAHTTTANSYSWVVSSFAKGSYFVRVECYRRDIGLHYAFDTVAVYLNR